MTASHRHVATILLILFAPLLALGDQPVKADRTPLTFRDCGLYCNYGMWHGIRPETEDSTNMLPASRAVSDRSPWTFYVMQYHAPKERRPDFDGASIREMAKNGKKVILRAGVGRMHKDPNVDELEQRLVTMFREVNPDWLYAITLDEEQIFWNGWGPALTELYHRCKKRWPELPVYQWWSPMQVPNVRAKSGWTAIPADGWMIDLYGRGAWVLSDVDCRPCMRPTCECSPECFRRVPLEAMAAETARMIAGLRRGEAWRGETRVGRWPTARRIE